MGMAVAAIVAIVVIGLVLITGLGGSHGPQRHGSGDEAGTSRPARSIAYHPDTVERW
jgi:hypothetical protein